MSEQIVSTNVTLEEVQENEREYLKERASLLGLEFQPNIPTTKLKELITQKMEENDKKTKPTRGVTTISQLAPEVIKAQDNALALVRFKITVLNPALDSATGVLVTAGNANIAPVRRVIPLNTEVWHAERIIIEHLKAMKYQAYKSKFNPRFKSNLDNVDKPVLKPSFMIEELPMLTQTELDELAKAQAAQGTGTTDAEQADENLLRS